jgi:hypothetical protein
MRLRAGQTGITPESALQSLKRILPDLTHEIDVNQVFISQVGSC